jgi:hypothetical protein
MIDQQKPMLMVHEWLAIAAIMGLLGMFTAIALIRNAAGEFRESTSADIISNPMPKKPMITVFIEGQVESPGALVVPKGTRLMDLAEKIQFHDNAELQPLRKKRRLKDQEIVRIEKKKKI